MKKFLAIAVLSLASLSSFAEATFDQIEGLIQQKNYAAAEAGLEVIIQNHPKSAKAFYAMAQAQAGLGNLEKAQKALNIATGLNPTLDFAPEGSVQKLKQAITPQTAKIEAVEESHALRNFVLFVMFAGFAAAMYFLYSVYARKQEEEQAERDAEFLREEKARQEREAERKSEHMEMLAKQDAERKAVLKAEEELKSHKNYGHERFDPANPDKLKSVKQFKAEQAEALRVMELREAQARAERAELEARLARSNASSGPAYAQPTHTTVVNNSNDGLLTGILIGDMMNHHNHETTRVVEREVIREVPASSSSRSSSWDDTPSTSSRSSSWDDSSSSSSSSSWSSSSSDSSSSWSDSSSSSSSSSDW